MPPPARCVCSKARHGMWQVRVCQHSNALCVDANVHDRGAHHGAWLALAVLVDEHVGLEISLSRRSSTSSRHPHRLFLARSNVVPVVELLVKKHHARQVQGLQLPFATDREHAHALQANLGAQTGLKHRAWRSSCRARHSVERKNVSERVRWIMPNVWRDASFTTVPISAKTLQVRCLFSGLAHPDASA